MNEDSSLLDRELIEGYIAGNRHYLTILFERHRQHIEEVSRNCVRLSGMSPEDKASVAYLVFIESFTGYSGRNGASFKTYIKRCIKNALISEYRKEKAQKRRKFFSALSLDSDEGQEIVNEATASYWRSHRESTCENSGLEQLVFPFAE